MEVASVAGRLPPQEDGAYGDVASLAKVFIDAHFRGTVHMIDLCGATGAGVRTVQRRFRQRFGVTVSSYLKTVRLDAAYRDLITSHPSRDTVTAIALRNGWRHFGRFSCEFRERFGQLPRVTLRSERSWSGLRTATPSCSGRVNQKDKSKVEKLS